MKYVDSIMETESEGEEEEEDDDDKDDIEEEEGNEEEEEEEEDDNDEEDEDELSHKVPTDITHESDLRWKENLFYRGEEELTRRRVFSNNLMQLVYGERDENGNLKDEEVNASSPFPPKQRENEDENEESDDDFFHPRKEKDSTLDEAKKQQRMLEELDSEKLDILPAIRRVFDCFWSLMG